MKKILLTAMILSIITFGNANENRSNDRDAVLSAIPHDRFAFDDADESLKLDRSFVIEAIKLNGFVLNSLDDKFKKDREIVLIAIKNTNGYAISDADKSLKNDKELLAISQRLKQKHQAAPQSQAAAISFMNDNCNEGEANACYSLAIVYGQGKYVEADLDKAEELLLKACNLKSQEACILYEDVKR